MTEQDWKRLRAAFLRLAAALREISMNGLEARMYVRGGLSDEDPCALAQCLLKQDPRLAAAALRGWAEHRSEGRPATVWHRRMAGVNLQVVTS